jgi:glycosyltransferase involved in cell wall biosynthesis
VIDDGVEGWVLPIRDPDAIAECLRRLYDDRNLQREMGRAARTKAEQYPWGRYGDAILEGVEPLLNPARWARLADRAGREHTIMQ